MNKFIEFIKRIFFRKKLFLNEAKTSEDEEYLNNKETFLDSIKAENNENNILALQNKIENGLIDVSKLSNEEVLKIKNLYCNQIIDLIDSIKSYKLKLN